MSPFKNGQSQAYSPKKLFRALACRPPSKKMIVEFAYQTDFSGGGSQCLVRGYGPVRRHSGVEDLVGGVPPWPPSFHS